MQIIGNAPADDLAPSDTKIATIVLTMFSLI